MSSQSIAFLGPNGTFAHLAAKTRFGANAHLVPQPTIKDVFSYVAENEKSVGIVPIENSSGGTIMDTVDCLVENAFDGLVIEESLAIKVNLALMGRDKEEIKVIYSHFAPLHHCQAWLDKHFPDARKEAVSSTAKAVQQAARKKGAAAIGNRMAGELYGLQVLEFPLKQDIQNVTQFFVLGHHELQASKNCRTSLVVTLRNVAGSLVDFLYPFKKEGINLTRIISRPIAGKPEAYTFLIDIRGPLNEPKVQKALAVAKTHSTSLRSLGTYPIRKRYDS